MSTLMTETAEETQTDATPSETVEQESTTVVEPADQQQQVETETGTESGEETTDSPEETEKPEGPPESYEFKAPEGREFDPEVIAEYSEVAKELGLTQENAQKMLDRIAPALEAKNQRVLSDARAEWASQSKADQEFGGSKLNENLALARKAIDQFGTPELRTLLDQSGLGDHPEVIRAFVRAGKAISEDSTVVRGQEKTTAADPANRMFPNHQ